MQIDQLVDTLASDLRPVRRRTAAGDALILGVICAVELAVYLALGKARPDLAAAVGEPSFWWKLISLGLLAAIGSFVTIASYDPAASPRRGLSMMVATAALCLAAGWGIDAARDGWPNLAVRLDWRDGLDCVSQMGAALPARRGRARRPDAPRRPHRPGPHGADRRHFRRRLGRLRVRVRLPVRRPAVYRRVVRRRLWAGGDAVPRDPATADALVGRRPPATHSLGSARPSSVVGRHHDTAAKK